VLLELLLLLLEFPRMTAEHPMVARKDESQDRWGQGDAVLVVCGMHLRLFAELSETELVWRVAGSCVSLLAHDSCLARAEFALPAQLFRVSF